MNYLKPTIKMKGTPLNLNHTMKNLYFFGLKLAFPSIFFKGGQKGVNQDLLKKTIFLLQISMTNLHVHGEFV